MDIIYGASDRLEEPPDREFERTRLRCDVHYYRNSAAGYAGREALQRSRNLALQAENRRLRRENAELRRQLSEVSV